MLRKVLREFKLDGAVQDVQAIAGGLINQTWRVQTPVKRYVLQTVNTNVFARPELIAENTASLAAYFKSHHPHYIFPEQIPTHTGNYLLSLNNQVYRVFSFVENTVTHHHVSHAGQAYEAAAQFGKFTALLASFPQNTLHTTLPHFHDLALRYRQFEAALASGNEQRLQQAHAWVTSLVSRRHIVETYQEICANKDFRLRVTHHDTKISNVLFNPQDEGVCVIDLDTVMPGYFISDVGDMMRTYLSAANEEEQDVEKVQVRREVFEAIRAGYLAYMQPHLTTSELKLFSYAGQFMIYMQALRFLTDFLNNDVYYGEKYPGHNFIRAQNQIKLLEAYEEAFC